MNFLRCTKKIVKSRRLLCTHTKSSKLVGRDLKSMKRYAPEDISSLLWTAFDLEDLDRNGKCTKNVDAQILLLLDEPDLGIQTTAAAASGIIGAQLNVVVKENWENMSKLWILGKTLAINTDLIMCKARVHNHLNELADGANVPVVNVSNGTHNPLTVLSHLLAIQKRHGHLAGLTVAYISPPGPLLNSYLCILPKLKMNLKFACACNPKTPVSPLMLKFAQTCCKQYGAEMHECLTPGAAIKRSDVIITTSHSTEQLLLKVQDLEAANANWSFIHALLRGNFQIDEEIFTHKNSLVFDAVYFMKYVYAAVMLRLLEVHVHSVPEPVFNYDTNEKIKIYY